MTEKQDIKRSADLAESVAIDLRVVLNDAREKLAEYEAYVDSWDAEIATWKDGERDPRMLTERHVIERALEQLEDLLHVHTGGTRHMHFRTARTRLLQLAQAAQRR
jgi:hypothetical protein